MVWSEKQGDLLLVMIEIVAKGGKAGNDGRESEWPRRTSNAKPIVTEDTPKLRTADLRSPHRSTLRNWNSLINSHRGFSL